MKLRFVLVEAGVYLARIGEPFPFPLGDTNLATWPPREPSATVAAQPAPIPPSASPALQSLTQTPPANIDPGHGEVSAPQVTTPEFPSPDGV